MPKRPSDTERRTLTTAAPSPPAMSVPDPLAAASPPPTAARADAEPAPVPPAPGSSPAAAAGALHDALAEGGEMQQEPRGGWRFADPVEQAAHGAAAPPPPLPLPHRRDPFYVLQPKDEERAASSGDAQNPAHPYPRGGTWGTWDGKMPSAPGETGATHGA